MFLTVKDLLKIIILLSFFVNILSLYASSIPLSNEYGIVQPAYPDSIHLLMQNFIKDLMPTHSEIGFLDLQKIEKSIVESLKVLMEYIKTQGIIIEFYIEIMMPKNSGESPESKITLDVSLQIAYEDKTDPREYISPIFKDIPPKILEAERVTLTKKYTFYIDSSTHNRSFQVRKPFEMQKKEDKSTTSLNKKTGIFLIFKNGKHKGHTYKDIKPNSFINKNLTNVTIPDGIETIGSRSFATNRLSVLSIPKSVTYIGPNAFADNMLEVVYIYKDVELGKNAIGKGFEEYYQEQGRKSGYYVYINQKWIWQREVSREYLYRVLNKYQ